MSLPRITTLVSSVIVALSSGTNYIYSAYAPQLAARLRISHTKLNIIGLAGNIGVYSSGPFWGRIVDRRGPRILLASGFIFLLVGYSGIYRLYNNAEPDQANTKLETFSYISFITLSFCAFLTGAGGNGGLTSSVNATAKSFPDELRATTTGLVLSGFGLSAFYFSALAHLLFPGDTSSFLLLLAVGTSFPMILGFFLVRPIPLPGTSDIRDATSRRVAADIPDDGFSHSAGVDAVLGNDALVFEHHNDSRTTLLATHYHGSPHLQDSAYFNEEQRRISSRAHSVELAISPSRGDRRRSMSTISHRRNRSRVIEVMQDLHGKALLTCPDFWLLFSLLSLLSGTGLMYINNVGSISQALFAQGNPDFDPAESVKWQGMQVSIISIANCLGRILSGVGADLVKNRFSAPRTYCIVFIAMLFVLSQAIASTVDKVQDLWHASVLLGLAYGGMFGIFPTITIEWFGLGHFSENWGLVSLSPMIGGNIFSIAFGRNLDAHAPAKIDGYDEATNNTSMAGRQAPSGDQCFAGRECYVSSLYLTTFACLMAVCLSVIAAWKDRKRMIVKPNDYEEIIWEEEAVGEE